MPDQPSAAAKPSGAVQRHARPAPLDRGALNTPNLITLSRLVLAVVLFVMIGMGAMWLVTAALFLLAAGTDFLDGWLARKYGQITTLGRILDPFADKIIICGAFIFLLPVKGSDVTAWMVIIVVGREMFVTSLRGFLEQHGMDFSASLSGKLKMVAQCAAVTVVLVTLSEWTQTQYPWLVHTREPSLWIAVGFTVYSGVVYVFRAAAMLREQPRGEV